MRKGAKTDIVEFENLYNMDIDEVNYNITHLASFFGLITVKEAAQNDKLNADRKGKKPSRPKGKNGVELAQVLPNSPRSYFATYFSSRKSWEQLVLCTVHYC